MEQNIYNTVFHEVIRQVTVSCAERGQLLAKLRLVSMLNAPPGPSGFISKQSLEPEMVFWGGFSAVLSVSRQRYQSLLERIPRCLKALHTEAVAQRVLNRRLAEEIGRIRTSFQQLSTYVGRPAGRKLGVKTLKEIMFFHMHECVSVVLWSSSQSAGQTQRARPPRV